MPTPRAARTRPRTPARGSVVAAVHGVLPPHSHPQSEITAEMIDLLTDGPSRAAVLQRFHTSAQVGTRHLALPLERYRELDGFGAANDAWLEAAPPLAVRAVTGALEEAGLDASDVDIVYSTTVTGVAAPSLEARIAGEVGFRPDVKRVPLFGLGCVAGAAGLARVHDYLLGHPDDVAVLLSVELCSLTFQRTDSSVANFVGSGLFGDGAAAVVVVGPERAARMDRPPIGPTLLDSRSHLYPDTQRTMGWDVRTTGFQIVLGAEVPRLVEEYVGQDVRGFLADHDLTIPDVSAWVCHPGGPKVIEAMTSVLGLPPEALELTWRSLAEIGNLSSSSVLHVLRDTHREAPARGHTRHAHGDGARLLLRTRPAAVVTGWGGTSRWCSPSGSSDSPSCA